MLFTRPNQGFGLVLSNPADGVRAVINNGVSVTPAQNAYGSYVQLFSGAAVTDDVYEIWITINNVAVSTVARDCVVSVGLDAAGGTSYTSLVDLIGGPAAGYTTLFGTTYRFPLFIKAGTSIAVAGAINSATLTAFNVMCRLYCRPEDPSSLYVGTYIDQYGVTIGSSAGTGITEGAASEGTYVALGTLTRPCSWIDFGLGVNNNNMTASFPEVDIAIGDGSNKRVVIPNAPTITLTSEQIAKPPAGRHCKGSTNDIIYGRAQSSGSGNTGTSLAAYVVGP